MCSKIIVKVLCLYSINPLKFSFTSIISSVHVQPHVPWWTVYQLVTLQWFIIFTFTPICSNGDPSRTIYYQCKCPTTVVLSLLGFEISCIMTKTITRIRTNCISKFEIGYIYLFSLLDISPRVRYPVFVCVPFIFCGGGHLHKKEPRNRLIFFWWIPKNRLIYIYIYKDRLANWSH